MQQNAPFCVLLKKIPFYHGFFHTTGIFKDMTEQILYPKYNRIHHFVSWKKNSDPPAFSLSRVGMCEYGAPRKSLGNYKKKTSDLRGAPIPYY